MCVNLNFFIAIPPFTVFIIFFQYKIAIKKGKDVLSVFPSYFDKFLVEFLANNLYPRVWNIFSVMTDRMSIAVKPIGRKIRERRDFMSLLQGILTRLVSLQEQAESGEVAQRYFEVNGERKCSVKFFDKSEMYELEVYQQGENLKCINSIISTWLQLRFTISFLDTYKKVLPYGNTF